MNKPKSEEFKPGDVVRLFSGGCDMVVVDVIDTGKPFELHCEWLNKKGNYRAATFRKTSLTKNFVLPG